MDRRVDKPRERRRPPPLDTASIERLALRYVERFATTRARLVDYLKRKVRERGLLEGAVLDLPALAERFAELGYIDDLAYGTAKAGSMGRRGLGARRVSMALQQAGLDEEDRGAILSGVAEQAEEAALTYARRKRIGPWAQRSAEQPERQKQLAAMVRAGHAFDLARRVVAMRPGEKWSSD